MKKVLLLSAVFFATSVVASQSVAGNLPIQSSLKSTQKLPIKRGPASFTQGFKVLSKTCKTRKSPSMTSQSAFQIPSGKKIWLTAMDSQWLIAKTQSSKDIYIHASCVN